jgi:hypothetical protein
MGHLVFSYHDFTSIYDYYNLFWKERFRENFGSINDNPYKINEDICRLIKKKERTKIKGKERKKYRKK